MIKAGHSRRKWGFLFAGSLLAAGALQLFYMASRPVCWSYGETWFADKVLVNNVWNHDGASGAQCIFAGPRADAGKEVRLAWSWASRNTAVPKSSAGFTYGYSPWRNGSTTPALPARQAALGDLKVRYDVATVANGGYDTVLKLYLTGADHPTAKDIRAEVMIWLDSQMADPWGEHRGALRAGKKDYGLWAGKMESWNVIILKPLQPAASGVLDVGGLLKALAARRDIDPGAYLAALELGDDITSGAGYTRIRDFAVEIRPSAPAAPRQSQR